MGRETENQWRRRESTRPMIDAHVLDRSRDRRRAPRVHFRTRAALIFARLKAAMAGFDGDFLEGAP
jgi:hypothetical protein